MKHCNLPVQKEMFPVTIKSSYSGLFFGAEKHAVDTKVTPLPVESVESEMRRSHVTKEETDRLMTGKLRRLGISFINLRISSSSCDFD